MCLRQACERGTGKNGASIPITNRTEGRIWKEAKQIKKWQKDHAQDDTKRVGGKASGSSKTVVDKRVEVMPGIDG